MVRVLGSAVLLLLVAVVALPEVAANPGVVCTYATSGTAGELTIVNAAGRPYSAFRGDGFVISSGVVTSSFFVTPVLGAVAGQIVVRVGDEVFLTGDRNSMWE